MFKIRLEKSLPGKLLFLFFLLPFCCYSQTTVNWVGGTSADWALAANWSSGSVPGTNDQVQIGIAPFSNAPVLSTAAHIASLTIGGERPVVLTISAGAQLLVDGNLIQSHGAGSIATGSTITGAGSLSCGSMYVGNYTISKILKDKTTTMVSKLANLSVTDSLTVYSTTTDLLSGGIAHNNSVFSLEGGILTVGKLIKLDNQMPVYLNNLSAHTPVSKFVININSDQNATLKISRDSLFKIKNTAYDTVDFNHHVSGTGKGIVEYSGADQTVLTDNTLGFDQVPFMYQSLTVSGTGTKTAGVSGNNTLSMDGDMKIISSTLDLLAHNVFTNIGGTFTNYGGIKLGGSTIVQGSTFFNAGQFNSGTGLLQLAGAAQQLKDSTASGTNIRNVLFSNTGTKTIQTGSFLIPPLGRLSLNNTAQLNVASGASLTISADTTGAAAITAIPQGSAITGLVTVEQFITGGKSPTGQTYRGYRLMTSPVYNAIGVNGERDYNFLYLKGTNDYNGVYLAGPLGTTGGFQSVSNPTIYMLREDVSLCNSSFTCGYYKSALIINNPDPNDIGSNSRFNTSTTADTTIRFPIGNGTLVFFRGNKVLTNNSTSGTKTTPPYNIPENVTIPNTGNINQGDVQIRAFFRNDNILLYTNSSTLNNTARGIYLVGNPYPASINWDKWSATDPNAPIYGPGLTGSISIYNPLTAQFNSYQPDPSHDPDQVYYGVGIASNIVSSSLGFNVNVDGNSSNQYQGSLLFRETAKSVSLQMPVAPTSSRLLAKISNKTVSATTVSADRLIRIKLVQDQFNEDEILIRFRANASAKFLRGEDSVDPGGAPEATTMLSSYSSDHVPLDINWMPIPDRPEHILLYVNATATGGYHLKASEIKDIPAGIRVLLRDKMIGKLINLRLKGDYVFNIDKNNTASFGDRFELILTNQKKN